MQRCAAAAASVLLCLYSVAVCVCVCSCALFCMRCCFFILIHHMVRQGCLLTEAIGTRLSKYDENMLRVCVSASVLPSVRP